MALDGNSSSSQPLIPTFKGQNYHFWCLKMQTLFKSQELWELVKDGYVEPEGSKDSEPSTQLRETRKKDSKALLFIQMAMDDNIFPRISTAKTSKEAWDIVKQEYFGDKKVITVKLQTLRRDFETLFMKADVSVQDFLSRVSNLVNHMKSLGATINSEIVVSKVLRSLDPKFDHVVTAIEESRNLSTYKFDELMGSLTAPEDRMNRLTLPDICRHYTDVVEKQLEVVDLPDVHLSLTHQVVVWELIKVLFSERDANRSSVVEEDEEEEMMLDGKVKPLEFDLEALPLIRRATFSSWLQEVVYHRVQDDVSCLSDSSDLEQILLLLTGRQLDAAVELSASRGDVRLACLLSEAGGSMVNRSDVGQQLETWRINGMDFHFIEKDRVRLYELLSGNIHSAFAEKRVDWKRFLGLLMWYELPPDTPLPVVFRTYQQLLTEDKAPYPVPTYIDEGPIKDTSNVVTEGRFDLAYYLMLLHSSEDAKFHNLKSMFSAFASSDDPLDYHMIWHQRGILEAIDAFSSNDLHILDMAYVSQLLCVGKCHWAIYVVLHIPYCEDFPYLHATVIREILFQYCETWSSSDEQTKFIEDLGVPSQWLHEAMAVYFQYYGDPSKALEHYIKCASWQKAHLIFITSVVHSLFLSDQDSEIWRLATSMKDYKSEIEDWDLGAGVYISFYVLRSSLLGDDGDMSKLQSLEDKESACKEFLDHLNKSLDVLKSKLPFDARDVRVAYSKMSEVICSLLLTDSGEDSTRETQLSCYDTVATAPLPEDIRSCHLQDAVRRVMDGGAPGLTDRDVWHDKWINGCSPVRRVMDGGAPSFSDDIGMVGDFQLQNGNWNEQLVHDFFETFWVNKIKSIHIPYEGDDYPYWPLKNDGEYSVKTGYGLALEDFQSSISLAMDNKRMPCGVVANFVRRKLWNLDCNRKWKIFLWKILMDVLPLGSEFKRQNLSVQYGCVVCGDSNALETMEHLFRDCHTSRHIWRASSLGIHSENGMDCSLKEWVCNWINFIHKGCDKKDNTIKFLGTLWTIWWNRNNMIFRDQEFDFNKKFSFLSHIIHYALVAWNSNDNQQRTQQLMEDTDSFKAQNSFHIPLVVAQVTCNRVRNQGSRLIPLGMIRGDLGLGGLHGKVWVC